MEIFSASARRRGNSAPAAWAVMSLGPEGTIDQFAAPFWMVMPRSFSSTSTLFFWPVMSHLPLAWEMETAGAPHSDRGRVWAKRGMVDKRKATAMLRGSDCIVRGWTLGGPGWFQGRNRTGC